MTQSNQNSQNQPPTRRDFLGQTVAAAAVTSLLGSSVARAEDRDFGPVIEAGRRAELPAGAAVRIAVIGTGGMGTAHCNAIIGLNKAGRSNVEIVAVCDVNKIRLDAAHTQCKEKQGISVDRYANYHDVLSRDDIHGVLIATPEHWHHRMAVDAFKAGKDVYLEKPMTLHLDEALHLREVVLANPQMIFQVGTQKMMLPKWIKAGELIAAGGIGKPVFSQTSYCRNSKDGEWKYYYIDPQVVPGPNLDWDAWCGPKGVRPFDGAVLARWRRYKDFSTGIVGDLLVHQMTPLMMALNAGWPTRVTGAGGHYIDKEMQNHDQVNMQIEFEQGHSMIVAGSTCNEIGLETIIRGHHATLYLNGRNVVLRPERIYTDDVEPMEVECEDIGNDQDALRANWIECIRTREPARSGIDLATKMMVAVALATRSMWEGHAFRFDPVTMKASKV